MLSSGIMKRHVLQLHGPDALSAPHTGQRGVRVRVVAKLRDVTLDRKWLHWTVNGALW